MKFIMHAQLPQRLARDLAAAGHDVTHTLELPLGNHTPDGDIAALAAREGRVLVTKDSDFVTTFLLHGTPPKLLLISTGNISNDALSRLVAANLTTLETAFARDAGFTRANLASEKDILNLGTRTSVHWQNAKMSTARFPA